jgi:nucleoside-diphosphate-sugar epimerase
LRFNNYLKKLMQIHGAIFITGATGYIGGSVAQKLVNIGHRVRGLVRSKENADLISKLGIEPVMGDLNDADLLVREANEAGAVVNAASADHSESVQALIKGLAGSFKPFIHTSGSSIVGDDVRGSHRNESIFDEYTPLVVQKLKQPRRNIDLMVLGAAAENVRSTVICPSLVYGEGRGLNTKSIQILFLTENAQKQGAVQIVGAGLNVWSNIHIDDLVDLYVLALSKAPAGSFYFAENGETSFAQIGSAIATRLGFSTVEALNPDIAAQLWGVPRAYYSFGSNSRVRSVRAKQELGWMPKNASAIDWILNEMPI